MNSQNAEVLMPHRAKKKVDWNLRFKKVRQPSNDSSSEEQSKCSGFETIFGILGHKLQQF